MRGAVIDALLPGGLWTDPAGAVHIRHRGTGRTYCDTEVGPYSATPSRSGCDRCVDASLADYTQQHVCGKDCRE